MMALGGFVIGMMSLLPAMSQRDGWTTLRTYPYRKGTVRAYQGGYGPQGGWLISRPKMGTLRKQRRFHKRGLVLRLVDPKDGLSTGAIRLGRHRFTTRSGTRVVLHVRDVRPQMTSDLRRGDGEPDDRLRRRLAARRLLADVVLRAGRHSLELRAENQLGSKPGWWSVSFPNGARIMWRFHPKTGNVRSFKVMR